MRIATLNVNNLFDAYNFAVELEREPTRDEVAAAALAIRRRPEDPEKPLKELGLPELGPTGALVKQKPLAERVRLAERIVELDADVLLVQEVEHRDALREFNALPRAQGGLGGRYRWVACIDGNDPRRIDVGVLSDLPLGAVTSWQHVEHPDAPGDPIFSRDLLEIDVLTDDFADVRLTCFVSHLKSHFVRWEPGQTQADAARAHAAADERRTLQADMIARILKRRALDRPHLVAGDFNDPPDAPTMAPLRNAPTGLLDALTAAVEEPPYTLKEEDPPPGPVWTYRHREDGQTTYRLFDHLWLNTNAADKQRGAGILRRTKKTKDGTDHDPAWVELDL